MGSYFLISIFGSILALIVLIKKPLSKKLGTYKIPSEDKIVLLNFIVDHQNNEGSKINKERAIQIVRDGVIEICLTDYFLCFENKSRRSHSSNGLLITKNGYFITCFHCVNSGIDDLVIIDHDGKSYSIEKICAYDKKNDIALVKCKMKIKREHITYKYEKNVSQDQLLTQLTKREGDTKIQGTHFIGSVIIQSSKIKYLGSKTVSKPGDSGGIIANDKGGIVSIIHGSGHNHDEPKDRGTTLSIPFKKFIELIQQACQ